ncbi:DUF4942 domain-containing protein [Providencia rettgeri]|uniref:DUF4942 domain-containing protein n=1 Tax=Providencia rettgeri TaxID=587 RepID=A0A939SL25_PRORE|nr:DUF4942 domain-containing protein [Providencia rettgeri]
MGLQKQQSPLSWKKIIIDNAITVGKYSTRFNKTDTVNDLVRIFCLLEQKPIHEFQNSVGLYISDNVQTNNKNFETEFFFVKWYKRHNASIILKVKHIHSQGIEVYLHTSDIPQLILTQ